MDKWEEKGLSSWYAIHDRLLLFLVALSVYINCSKPRLIQMKFCRWESQTGDLTGSFPFPLHHLSPFVGRGSGPNRAVGAEIDEIAVCLTLLPFPDNKINFHSSTMIKVPCQHHLFLFSSLAPSLLSAEDSFRK